MVGLFLLILHALQILIFIDVILSWVMRDDNAFPRNITTRITDPLYAPIRAVLNPQRMGGLDISPLIVLVLLRVMESAVAGAGR